jgi:uncharacterized protein (DUF58 family)
MPHFDDTNAATATSARGLAVLTLTVSALFLLFVGAFLNTRSLFFMSTVMIVMLVSLRLQAWLATRGLRFERIAPTVMVAGERVAMRIRVWSTIRIRRPLLFIVDDLPASLQRDADMRPLPVAPSYEEAIETTYELMPLKRGVYRWAGIRVESTDSLGLVSVEAEYETQPFEVIVHPAKIPLSVDLASLTGWGANQADEGRNRGHGMEPRGVREFMPGDSLRHVHWRTTARTGTIQVKEFETGFNTRLNIVLQLTRGSEAGEGAQTTLEAMCGHAAFLADVMLQRGSTLTLPNLEENVAPASSAAERFRQVCDALAAAEAKRPPDLAQTLSQLALNVGANSTLVVLLSAAEDGVAQAIRQIANRTPVIALLYDPNHYSKDALPSPLLPCTDPDFMAALSGTNVLIKVMPNPYARAE